MKLALNMEWAINLMHALADEIKIGELHFGERVVDDSPSHRVQKTFGCLPEKPLRNTTSHHGHWKSAKMSVRDTDMVMMKIDSLKNDPKRW